MKNASETPAKPIKAVAADHINLQLPPAVYAVPGVEISIYFDNIVNVINPDNYVFDVTCAKGRNDRKRWRYTPAAGEKGSFDWEVKVISDKGIEAVGKTKIIVTPADTGKGKNFAVLILGDSLTAASIYPQQLYDLLTANGHPGVKFLGTTGRKTSLAKHEGYGGWAWHTFMTKTTPTKAKPGKVSPIYYRASPFIFNGKFSLAQYLKKYHKGIVPDFITIQLGVNDVFAATDANQKRVIDGILVNADKLIAALRKDAPDAVIGVGLVTAGAKTQDAFGANYKCGQTRWQYKKNQHALNAAMLKKFVNYPDKKVFIIPTNVNLDCENNFPVRNELISGVSFKDKRHRIVRQNNGVHPAVAGYHQMGDTFYCWIKYQLSK
ncbi:MAG: hypothetical protein IKA87_10100 [Lentisphaeria bacterium]|nr:hypothetical protein [Lentisphaeria bacterium]